MKAFEARGTQAWDDFVESRRDRPYPTPEVPADGEGDARQRQLEELYLGKTNGGG